MTALELFDRIGQALRQSPLVEAVDEPEPGRLCVHVRDGQDFTLVLVPRPEPVRHEPPVPVA